MDHRICNGSQNNKELVHYEAQLINRGNNTSTIFQNKNSNHFQINKQGLGNHILRLHCFATVHITTTLLQCTDNNRFR